MEDKCLGVLPNGCPVFASGELLAQIGEEKARYDLVDRIWFDETGSAPGYYPVRTGLHTHNLVWIKADSHDEAVSKYLTRPRTRIE